MLPFIVFCAAFAAEAVAQGNPESDRPALERPRAASLRSRR